jgi:lysophospholipase L1-like esterase
MEWGYSVMKQRASIKAKWLIVSAVLLIAVLVTSIVLLGQNNNAVKKQPTEKRLVEPTSAEWLYKNGTWTKVDVPGWGEVMKGDELYGRRARIETDSPIAVLKQRGIGGNVFITVDGKQVVNLGLDGSGGVNEIPIYSNSTGWHQIEVIFSDRRSEIDGLYISKDAKVRKPDYNKRKMVVIGHSYVEGCCASNIALKSFSALVGDILGVESINQGIGRTDINVANGTTKDSGLDRVQTDVINLKPDYVLSVYGYNVIGRISGDMTHKKYQDDYTKFIKMINDALPQTQVFASGISSVAGRSEESLKPYNDDIKNACANALNCTFIDLMGKFNESNYDKYIAPDGIHPSDEGHKFLAEEYAKVISSVMKK